VTFRSVRPSCGGSTPRGAERVRDLLGLFQGSARAPIPPAEASLRFRKLHVRLRCFLVPAAYCWALPAGHVEASRRLHLRYRARRRTLSSRSGGVHPPSTSSKCSPGVTGPRRRGRRTRSASPRPQTGSPAAPTISGVSLSPHHPGRAEGSGSTPARAGQLSIVSDGGGKCRSFRTSSPRLWVAVMVAVACIRSSESQMTGAGPAGCWPRVRSMDQPPSKRRVRPSKLREICPEGVCLRCKPAQRKLRTSLVGPSLAEHLREGTRFEPPQTR